MKYLERIRINNLEIENIYKENKRYIIKLKKGDILKTKDCITISYFCKECNKEVIENVTPYKIRHYFSDDFSCLCRNCELHIHPRIHIWTDEERKIRSEMYKGEKNPMYKKDWRIGKTQEELEAHRKHTSEGWYNMPDEKKKEKIKKMLLTNFNKSYEEKQEIKRKIKNTWNSKTKEELFEIRKRQSLAQKRCKDKNPEYYRQIKARGGYKSSSCYSSYKINKIEQKVENWLKEHNIDYTFCCILNGKDGHNYQYDFIIHNKKILIEVNGTYWHADPRVYNKFGEGSKGQLNEIQIKKIKADNRKKEIAEMYGFKLLYIWEIDINNNDFSNLNEVLNEN